MITTSFAYHSLIDALAVRLLVCVGSGGGVNAEREKYARTSHGLEVKSR